MSHNPQHDAVHALIADGFRSMRKIAARAELDIGCYIALAADEILQVIGDNSPRPIDTLEAVVDMFEKEIDDYESIEIQAASAIEKAVESTKKNDGI